MSNENNGGCLVIAMLVIYAFAWFGTGIMAWDWIEPDSFWGGIKFLITWTLLGYLAHFIGGLIIAGLASLME
jgi:hypothetical protein